VLAEDILVGACGVGRSSVAVMDDAVRRVLLLKFEQGLFEHPFIEASALTSAAPTREQLDLTEEFAAGEANGKRTLVLRDAQHEYVFTEQ